MCVCVCSRNHHIRDFVREGIYILCVCVCERERERESEGCACVCVWGGGGRLEGGNTSVTD